MNYIYTAKILANKNTFADRAWYYNFRELNQKFDHSICKKVSSRLFVKYSKLTKQWGSDKNSEWLCRIYLSAKMIMIATLQLNVLNYAGDKNMRLVSPYLTYYSILSLLRAIVYTLPEIEWNGGKIVKISHKKAINLAFDYIAKFDQKLSEKFKQDTIKAKADRELISYRAPSSGDSNVEVLNNIKSMTTLLAEVAQFNSEILEASIIKYASNKTFEFIDQYITDLSEIIIETKIFSDQEDHYRLRYLKKKYPVAPNILHIMTEGHVEDFFGAWVSHEESDDGFDPDRDWQLIFDIP